MNGDLQVTCRLGVEIPSPHVRRVCNRCEVPGRLDVCGPGAQGEVRNHPGGMRPLREPRVTTAGP